MKRYGPAISTTGSVVVWLLGDRFNFMYRYMLLSLRMYPVRVWLAVDVFIPRCWMRELPVAVEHHVADWGTVLHQPAILTLTTVRFGETSPDRRCSSEYRVRSQDISPHSPPWNSAEL